MAEARSLRATLVLWMVPSVLAVFTASIILTQSTLSRLADSAYDRSLAGALRAIEANVAVTQGGFGFDLPYVLFANLQATSGGTVYVRISTDDGLVDIGDPGLPGPAGAERGIPRFSDAAYLDQDIRVGVLQTRLSEPLYGAAVPQMVTIRLAETTMARDAFLAGIVRVAFWRDAAAVLGAMAVLAVAMAAALRPLARLRARFDRRAPDDLSPVDPAELPAEVRPLIRSFNTLLGRHGEQALARKRFLDDASHQMRTPISVLGMQVDHALTHPQEREDTLRAMRGVLDRANRSISQLLALARVDAAAIPMTDVDVADLVRGVALLHLRPARRKRLILDLDLPETPLRVAAAEGLLHEAVSNLLDNAIRLSPEGATIRITLRAKDGIHLHIADRGPGMDEAQLARLGQRFASTDGVGLGLAFGMAVARMHGGRLTARNRSGGGLDVAFHLPLPVLKAD